MEIQEFYRRLAQEKRCIILSLVPGYAKDYEPLEIKYPVPKPFSELYNPLYKGKQKQYVIAECERLMPDIMSISQDEIAAIEKATRGQASNATWYGQRTGRITGCRVKQVMRSSLIDPSISLLKAICYPELTSFHGNEATR